MLHDEKKSVTEKLRATDNDALHLPLSQNTLIGLSAKQFSGSYFAPLFFLSYPVLMRKKQQFFAFRTNWIKN